MSHTPGPWHWESTNRPEVDIETFESPGFYGNLSLVGANGMFVAGCDEYDVFGSLADRHLLAAAPELLACCKAALVAKGTDAVDWDDIRRAVAKAEGRA